jgi:hypothetical protein
MTNLIGEYSSLAKQFLHLRPKPAVSSHKCSRALEADAPWLLFPSEDLSCRVVTTTTRLRLNIAVHVIKRAVDIDNNEGELMAIGS